MFSQSATEETRALSKHVKRGMQVINYAFECLDQVKKIKAPKNIKPGDIIISAKDPEAEGAIRFATFAVKAVVRYLMALSTKPLSEEDIKILATPVLPESEFSLHQLVDYEEAYVRAQR